MTERIRVDFDALDMGENEAMLLDGWPFTGTAFETYPDGTRRGEAEFVDGLHEGVSRDWYPTGQLKREITWWRGAGHGRAQSWDEDGHLVQEEVLEFGITVRERQWNALGEKTKEWSIGPSDNLHSALQLARTKYGSAAPAVAPEGTDGT